MRKIIAIAVMGLLAALSAACGKTEEPSSNATAGKVGTRTASLEMRSTMPASRSASSDGSCVVAEPDGEGSIMGTWSIGSDHTGSFLLRPRLQKPTGDEPIHEIG